MLKYIHLIIIGIATFSSQGQILIHNVFPSETDHRINSYNDFNVSFYNPIAVTKNKLVVVLPSTAGKPMQMQVFDSVAANQGFHVIGLMYNNTPDVSSLCENSEDEDCFYNTRREVIDGEELSNTMQVDTNHCIENRLRAMLSHLHSKYPNEGWGQYLSGDNIEWSNVIAAGHAQGAGMAALMGKLYSLDRVVCLAGPNDYSTRYNRPAKWLSLDGKTLADRYYSFFQEDDSLANNFVVHQSLQMTDYGLPVIIEKKAQPYNFTRILKTKFISNYNNSIVALDAVTPWDDFGYPRFSNAWRYMLTNYLTTSSEEVLEEKITVFPNPVMDVLSINVSNDVKYQLINSTGIIVESGESTEVNMSAFSSGLYLLSVKLDEKWYSFKVLKN
jgi:hypothetical protein